MTVKGRKQTFRELETLHHIGSRKCVVDYETKKIADKTLALPVRVVVYAPDGQNVLRSSRLMNFKQVDMNDVTTGKSADAFASFDGNEWKTREMLLKYWMKDASEIEAEDLKILRQLQTHFEQISAAEKTPGEQLRRINMLFQLDWILGDGDSLQEHFEQYLALLRTNGLNRMVLVGGQYAIETTFRWGLYVAADRLLEKWIDAAVAVNDEEAVLSFGQSAIRKDRFRTIAGLMEKSLSSQKWGQKQFDAGLLKFSALHGLYQMLQNPDKIQEGRRQAQATWVLSSTSMDQLRITLRKSIANAQKAFAELKNPTPEQKEMKKQLDMALSNISQADNDVTN